MRTTTRRKATEPSDLYQLHAYRLERGWTVMELVANMHRTGFGINTRTLYHLLERQGTTTKRIGYQIHRYVAHLRATDRPRLERAIANVQEYEGTKVSA